MYVYQTSGRIFTVNLNQEQKEVNSRKFQIWENILMASSIFTTLFTRPHILIRFTISPHTRMHPHGFMQPHNIQTTLFTQPCFLTHFPMSLYTRTHPHGFIHPHNFIHATSCLHTIHNESSRLHATSQHPHNLTSSNIFHWVLTLEPILTLYLSSQHPYNPCIFACFKNVKGEKKQKKQKKNAQH